MSNETGPKTSLLNIPASLPRSMHKPDQLSRLERAQRCSGISEVTFDSPCRNCAELVPAYSLQPTVCPRTNFRSPLSNMTNPSSLAENQPAPLQTRPPAVEGPLVLKPLRLANCEIEFPIVQAALSGYSDWPMRVVARRLGAPYTVAEVLIDRFVLELKQRHKTRRHLMVSDEEHPV
ncbi:MAG: hypothetical protein ACI92S_002476, partial [Planctomycetaceae bacterium]